MTQHNPDRGELEAALRVVAGVPVHDSPGLTGFSAKYLNGWGVPAAEINEALDTPGPLAGIVRGAAVRCVLDAVRPEPEGEDKAG